MCSCGAVVLGRGTQVMLLCLSVLALAAPLLFWALRALFARLLARPSARPATHPSRLPACLRACLHTRPPCLPAFPPFLQVLDGPEEPCERMVQWKQGHVVRVVPYRQVWIDQEDAQVGGLAVTA